jgi:membrane protein YdbS with pleckstrin-like domain
MITIQCDNCDRSFEPLPDQTGGKVACPYCGDVNRVPASESVGAVATAREAPTREAAQSADVGQSASPGETELCVIRPGMFRAHPFRYALIILLFLAGAAGIIAALTTDRIGMWAIWPSLVLIVGTGAWFGWWWMSTHFWVRLVVSNKRTIRHEGIIKRHTTEVLHDHVRSVDIRQTFLERIFNVGTIGIDSAGQDGIEIEVHDIPMPYEIKKMIDKHRKM